MKIISFEDFSKDANDKYEFYLKDFQQNIEPKNPLVRVITRDEYLTEYKQKYDTLVREIEFRKNEIKRHRDAIEIHVYYLNEECPIVDHTYETIIESKQLHYTNVLKDDLEADDSKSYTEAKTGILFKRCYLVNEKRWIETEAYFDIEELNIHKNFQLVEITGNEITTAVHGLLDKHGNVFRVTDFTPIGRMNDQLEWIAITDDIKKEWTEQKYTWNDDELYQPIDETTDESNESNTSPTRSIESDDLPIVLINEETKELLDLKQQWHDYYESKLDEITYPYQCLEIIINGPYKDYEIPKSILHYIEKCKSGDGYKIESGSKTEKLLNELSHAIYHSLYISPSNEIKLFTPIWKKLKELTKKCDQETKQKRFDQIDIGVYQTLQNIITDYIHVECNGAEQTLDSEIYKKMDKFLLKKNKDNKFNALIYYATFFLYAGVRPNSIRELWWNPNDEQNGFRLIDDAIYFVHNYDKNVKTEHQKSITRIENEAFIRLLKYSLFNETPIWTQICNIRPNNEAREFKNFTKTLVGIELTPTDIRTLDVSNDIQNL